MCRYFETMKRLLLVAGFLNVVRSQGPLDAPFPPGFINEPLKSEAYSEGACITPDVANNADVNWVIGLLLTIC